MAYNDPLTDQELLDFNLNPEIIRYLEDCEKKLGKPRDKVKILDWGCGKGREVMQLRQRGFDAYGADVSQVAIDRGRDYFTGHGVDFNETLKLIKPDGSLDFPEDRFDFIYSNQVFEHVEDLESTIEEIARLTAPRGIAIHIFPAHRVPIEPHLFMPFVHWLPKSWLRKSVISLFVSIKIEPRWDESKGRSNREKTEIYNNFSVKETYYRPYKTLSSAFESKGFKVDFVSIDHPKFSKTRLNKFSPIRRLVNWLVLNFKTVELLAIKER